MTDLTAIATELLRLSGEATEAPWSVERDWSHEVIGGNGFTAAKCPHEIDAALIATSRNHIDALCRLALAVLPAVERLREARDVAARCRNLDHVDELDRAAEFAVDALLAAVDGATKEGR